MDADQLTTKVSEFLQSIGWNDETKTTDAARDLYVTLDTMVEFIVDKCMSGSGKGPGPLPRRPPPPWPVSGGVVSRRQDYVTHMTALLLNIANKSEA
jgi:hypothetical protein